MSSPKVSIIVPVFNVENYLRKCLDSLLNQTLIDIEIICIDDCSTDGCRNVLQEYLRKDIRIKAIFNESNIGQGLSRNKGLKIAQGEYIGFVDGDDWVNKTMFERMYEIGCEGNEIVGCNYSYLNFNDEIIRVDINPYTNNPLLKDNIILRLFGEKKDDINRGQFTNARSCCTKIYNRSFITGLNIAFQSERSIFSEDWLFNAKALLGCNSIGWVNETLYNYIRRETSTMNIYKPNYLVSRMLFQKKVIELILDSKVKMKSALLERLDWDLFSFSFAYIANEFKLGFTNGIKGIFSLGKNEEMASVFKRFSIFELPYYDSVTKNGSKYLIYILIKYF
jgi:glycosyltransferase involved in cell wall biosynthesis